MNKSKYTIELCHNNSLTLVNTLYGSIVNLHDKYVDDYYSITSGSDKPDIYTSLIEEGIICDKDNEEVEIEELKNALLNSSNHLDLTILTTTACNMRCTYCFERLEAIMASEKISDQIMDFIERYNDNNNLKSIHITWFGGEPLLNLSLIRNLSVKLIHFSDNNGIIYNASIITNGTLLSEDISRELHEKHRIISAQITVDGVGEVHNLRRPYPGRNGFEIIMNNIRKACQIMHIIIRTNVDSGNITETTKLIDYISSDSILKSNVYLDFSRVVGNEVGCMTLSSFEMVKLGLMDKLIDSGITENINNISAQGILAPCSVLSRGSYIIYPNGDLYKCYEVVGKKEYCVGNITDYPFKERENLIASNYKIAPECENCAKLPLCNKNICPYRYTQNDRTIFCDDDKLLELCKLIQRTGCI